MVPPVTRASWPRAECPQERDIGLVAGWQVVAGMHYQLPLSRHARNGRSGDASPPSRNPASRRRDVLQSGTGSPSAPRSSTWTSSSRPCGSVITKAVGQPVPSLTIHRFSLGHKSVRTKPCSIELRQILTENEHVEILVRPGLLADQGVHAPPTDYPAADASIGQRSVERPRIVCGQQRESPLQTTRVSDNTLSPLADR